MSRQTAVRLADDTFERLRALAERTGRTVTFYIREAVETHIEDLEDAYLAEQALDRLRAGEDDVMSSETFWRELED